MQISHEVAPLADWYVPLLHRSHSERPAIVLKLPGMQSSHALASLLPGIGLALPGGQLRHALLLDAPASELYVPAAHCSKVMLALAAPSDAQKPPVGQALQLVARSLAPKLPAGHLQRRESNPTHSWVNIRMQQRSAGRA